MSSRLSAGVSSRTPWLLAFLGAATFLEPDPVEARPAQLCPAHVYRGNAPSKSESPDWSESAQGIANDGEHWFFTNRRRLMKYERNWSGVHAGPDDGKLASVGIPRELRRRGINHFGDPDYHGGYVFVPFEGPRSLRAVIAAFRASDLSLVDWVDITRYQHKTGWVAVDVPAQQVYTSLSSLSADHQFHRYDLHLSKIDNGVEGDFLTRAEPMAALDFGGEPIAGRFIYMQGGVFTPWGDLYIAAGRAAQLPTRTRAGIHLFRRTADGRAFQLVQSTNNQSVDRGTCDFAYAFAPRAAGGQEPEGIDWWNQNDDPHARYPGQLHAILLDNQVDDDDVWLKHYTVDYFCMLEQDSDGDGTSDGDEVYEHNTHPLLAESRPVATRDVAPRAWRPKRPRHRWVLPGSECRVAPNRDVPRRRWLVPGPVRQRRERQRRW